MIKKLFPLFVVALVLLTGSVLYIATFCPCDRIPGVALLGEDQVDPVVDWTFANEAPLCQLQVNNRLLPHSINLNCMSGEGELFISCSRCQGKRWSSIALSYPDARIRIGENVYPVKLERLTDPGALDRSWAARATKLQQFGRDGDAARPEHWWSFQLVSR